MCAPQFGSPSNQKWWLSSKSMCPISGFQTLFLSLLVQKPPILPFVWLKGGFLLYHCGYRQFFMWLTWPTQPKYQHRLSSSKHAATRTRTTQKVMEARRTPRTQPRKHSLAQEYLGVDANKLEHLDITTEVLVACGQEIFRHSKYEEQDWLRDNLSYLQGPNASFLPVILTRLVFHVYL